MENIIFQNEYFVAIDKPALTLTVPGREGEKDPRPVLGLMLQDFLKKKVFPVHRLDFGVSGVVLFAIDQEAHRAANRWFENRDVKKNYQALTQRIQTQNVTPQKFPLNELFLWKSFLVRGKKRVFEASHGQESLTEAEYFGDADKKHRWQLSPLTGRSHQLRYELGKRGYPILGDKLYGSTIAWPEGIALRAISLEFLNPEFSQWKLPKKISAEPIFTITV